MIDKSYILYGPQGIEEVYCLNCGEIVRIRAAGTLTSRDGRKFDVNELMSLPTYRKGPSVKVNTVKGPTVMHAIICSKCEGKEIDKAGVLKQYKDDMLKSAMTDEQRAVINSFELGE